MALIMPEPRGDRAAAAEEEFVFAADAVNALYEGGFNIGKFKTFSKGFHYAYGGPDDNQFYLLNKEGKIVFPEKVDDEPKNLWGFFNNEKSDKIEGVTKYIALTAITDANLFNKDDCVFGGNDNYTIDLNDKIITVADDGKNIYLKNGTVLFDVSDDYNLDDKSTTTQKAATTTSYTAETVEIKDLLFTKKAALELTFSANTTKVVLKNCTFDLSTTNSAIYIGTKATAANVKDYELINCTFSLGAANVFVRGSEKLPNVTIKNCTFSTGRGLCLGANVDADIPKFGNILLEGNTFIDNGTAEGKPSIQFSAAGSGTKTPKAFVANSITIKNNDFLCKDIAIRIHESVNALTCDKLVIIGNNFSDNVEKIVGDNTQKSDEIAKSLAPNFE